MGRLEQTDRALQDLDEIWDHIAHDNPTAADRVMRIIEAKANQLANGPQTGQQCPDWASGLRFATALPFPYVLFYRPLDDGIRLIRVLHGARDFPNQMFES